jgi:hypothetical protein
MSTPKSTNQSLESKRGMVAYKESTRDPIFLFQKLDYGCSEQDFDAMLALGWHCDEGWYTSDDIENADTVTPQMMADHDIGTKHWDTHHVFFSREEARQFGLRRPYHWGEEGVGWRVYCVCAEGELAEILVNHEKDQRILGNTKKALQLMLDFYKAFQKPDWKEGESAEAVATDVAVFLGQAVEDGWLEEFREISDD